jgi:SAM-dependent methyltransferase
MLRFEKRSYQKELLDGVDIPFKDIKKNMSELNIINQYLGGHHITISGLSKLLSGSNNREYTILEVGCGGGDNLRVVKRWADKNKITVALFGVDINAECIQYAIEINGNREYTWIYSDYKNLVFEEKPDIIYSSLFLHHFNDMELIGMIKWMYDNSRIGFFINDLHRHPLAYYSIKALTRAFSKSYLVKNDAPLSVLRAFTRNDWETLFSMANIPITTLNWKWAFRWLITCSKI